MGRAFSYQEKLLQCEKEKAWVLAGRPVRTPTCPLFFSSSLSFFSFPGPFLHAGEILPLGGGGGHKRDEKVGWQVKQGDR